MKASAKNFEIIILRPLAVIYIAISIIFLIKGMWLFLGGGVLCLFYLGIIGSKLHPYQSASDLGKGTLKGIAAVAESILLSPEIIKILVGRACTHVGLLIGFTVGIILWLIAGWHWYYAIPIALLVLVAIGSSLKIIFKTV